MAETLHDPALCQKLLHRLDSLLQGRPLRFMEVCGTHTVAIFRGGLRSLLPKSVVHLSGPGCPVCVTHDSEVAEFFALAKRPDVILATFGDLMRVPGPDGRCLKHAQAEGARIEVVYSPMDALDLAAHNPDATVVFPGIGFETTAPAVAATVLMAQARGIKNFAVLSCHKLVPPALSALLADPDCAIDAFLLPGHVSTVLGLAPYEFVASRYHRPAVVAGFEPADILDALCRIAAQLASGHATVENAYPRAVHTEGNPKAREILETVFQVTDARWRGLGVIAQSGLELCSRFDEFNARKRFDLAPIESRPIPGCRCGDVLKGHIIPTDCPLFGKICTPLKPVGPCMVSTEGSCSAYYKYGL
ncbi:MAG TPA: hydrogenase formation protein HypD [Candidatus Avidesulfovibrio excrementigallinarum]|nr:hydrogenase formation protein HypD [Candidatus Avidesulfovibrio excrementigallinarum]